MLTPGRYELLFNLDGYYNNGTEIGRYSLDFTTGTGTGTGAGNQPPAAVPLPPGAWAGLLTMGVAAAAGRYRRGGRTYGRGTR